MDQQNKISILHPSYGRPDLAMETYGDWTGNANEVHEYILCLSVKDPLLNDYKRIFKEHETRNWIKLIYSPHASMIEQVNLAASHSKGNLLINTSDDFRTPLNWDTILLEALAGKEDYIVKTQDGIQPFIHTLPMMDRKYYNRFGYIYHPDYKHFFGDEEIAVIGNMLNKTITLDILFPHQHYTVGGMKRDATNVKNDANFEIDRRTYISRHNKNFGL